MCAVAGAAVLIAGGCDANASTASTLESTTWDTPLTTTDVDPTTSATSSDPATANPVLTTASTATPSTLLSVPLGYARGPQEVSQALDTARVVWADASITSYRLTIAENRSIWTEGCKWNVVVDAGELTDNGVDPSSTARPCPPIEWTVEQLHQMIGYWLETVGQFGAFGDLHILDVQFNDNGVPVAMDYDLANGVDEESSLRVTFTATP